jgi:hypothetical protein
MAAMKRGWHCRCNVEGRREGRKDQEHHVVTAELRVDQGGVGADQRNNSASGALMGASGGTLLVVQRSWGARAERNGGAGGLDRQGIRSRGRCLDRNVGSRASQHGQRRVTMWRTKAGGLA